MDEPPDDVGAVDEPAPRHWPTGPWRSRIQTGWRPTMLPTRRSSGCTQRPCRRSRHLCRSPVGIDRAHGGRSGPARVLLRVRLPALSLCLVSHRMLRACPVCSGLHMARRERSRHEQPHRVPDGGWPLTGRWTRRSRGRVGPRRTSWGRDGSATARRWDGILQADAAAGAHPVLRGGRLTARLRAMLYP